MDFLDGARRLAKGCAKVPDELDNCEEIADGEAEWYWHGFCCTGGVDGRPLLVWTECSRS